MRSVAFLALLTNLLSLGSCVAAAPLRKQSSRLYRKRNPAGRRMLSVSEGGPSSDVLPAPHREVWFEFFGLDLSRSGQNAPSFNLTITDKLLMTSKASAVWVATMGSTAQGSILAELTLTYSNDASHVGIDADVGNMIKNAKVVFGDVSAWGVTDISGGIGPSIVLPDYDPATQREVVFRFAGPEFHDFLSGGSVYTQSFNATITDKLYSTSIASSVWVTQWWSGSIQTQTRLTYCSGTTQDQMDSDVRKMNDDAGTMFGDLSAWGVTSIRGVDPSIDPPRRKLHAEAPAPVAAAILAYNRTLQREVEFEFLGADCKTFLLSGVEKTQSFNVSITKKIKAGSLAIAVWITEWRSGSIIVVSRNTYAASTSREQMDADVDNMINSAATMFGDLKAWGVTAVRASDVHAGDRDGDDAKAVVLEFGLDVGIPLIVGIIIYCVMKKRRSIQEYGLAKYT